MKVFILAEIWKDIPGYEGLYQASSLGRIRSLDRYVEAKSKKGLWYKRLRKGKVLKTDKKIGKSGYEGCTLNKVSINVHRAVALAFLGNPPYLAQVNHINGNKRDNRAVNLEYCSSKENIHHAMKLGLFDEMKKRMSDKSRGEGNPKAKLTENQVRAIRQATSTAAEAAKVFGVSKNTVHQIRQKRTWKDVV
jgi:DNA-binding transcriptional regulator YiaG